MIRVPRTIVEQLRNSIDPNEVKDELLNSMNLEEDKKLTPQTIKEKLDEYVIGQDQVKRAVAIALSKPYLN
jgi:ATP-dependent protease Clp ATPase subunit